jgi:hypothetical protein
MTAFQLVTLMYHYVRDPGDDAEAGTGIPGWPVAAFAAQLDELGRRFEMVDWPDVRDCVTQGKPLPERACLLTFDDGVRDHYLNVFPALRARGMSGLFFALARKPGDPLALGHKIHFLLARQGVAAARAAVLERLAPEQQRVFLEAEAQYRAEGEAEIDQFKMPLQRDLSGAAAGLLSNLLAERVGPDAELAEGLYLTRGQIDEMAAGGMYFGGHSQTHPWFDWVSAAQQQAEIAASAAWLDDVHAPPWAFAYPYGGIGAESPGLLATQGFAAAFTTRPHAAQSNPLLLGRFDGESRFDMAVQAAEAATVAG